MSEVLTGAFKKPRCTDMHQSGVDKVQAHLRDVLGGLINLEIVGTDPDIDQPIIGNDMTEDYGPGLEESAVNPGYTRVNPDGTFYICIETAGTFAVVLADGTQFTITTVQATACLGQWYPGRICKVFATGTTGDFSVGY